MLYARTSLASSAAAVSRAVPAFASVAGSRRSYYPNPVPTVTREQVTDFSLVASPTDKEAQAAARAAAKPYAQGARPGAGGKSRGYTLAYRLNEHERQGAGEARRQGYLVMKNHCGEGMVNAHFKFCVHDRRPYVAVHRDGGSVQVDLTPVLGTYRKAELGLAREKDLEALSAAVKALVAQNAGAQVVNRGTLKAQAEKALPGPKEGTNANKINDVEAGEAFTLYTTSREQAVAFASNVYLAFVKLNKRATPEEAAATKAAAAAERQRAWTTKMVRRLRGLVADTEAVKNLRVAGGAVDGFVKVDADGKAGLPAALQLLAAKQAAASAASKKLQ